MAAMYLCMVVILMTCTCCMSQIEIVISPQNKAILADNDVKFQCKVDHNGYPGLTEYITWEECITPGDGTCLRISNDGSIVYSALGGDPDRQARYSISNPQTAQYNLKITGTVFAEDAGKYRCLSRNTAGTFKDSELILLDGNPTCSQNTTEPNEALEGEYIKMSCEVPYRGRWAPVISWKKDGSPVTDVEDESSTNLAKYSITIVATPDHNGNVYRTETKFNAPTGTGPYEASNTPDYTFDYQFEALAVWYSPYDLTISSDGGCLYPGDRITCNAEGSPVLTYRWIDANTSEVIRNTNLLVVSEEMLGYQWYMCTAENVYGKINDTLTFQVCITIPTTTMDTTTTKSTTLPTSMPLITCQSCSSLEVAVGLLAGLLCVSLLGNLLQLLFQKEIICKKKYPSEKRPSNAVIDTSDVHLNETGYESVGHREPVLPTVYDKVTAVPVYNNVNHLSVPNTDVQSTAYEEITTVLQ